MQSGLATWTGPLGASETMSRRNRVREDGRSASGEHLAVPLVVQGAVPGRERTLLIAIMPLPAPRARGRRARRRSVVPRAYLPTSAIFRIPSEKRINFGELALSAV